nr:hypothetical protein [Shuttleworthia satelles]
MVRAERGEWEKRTGREDLKQGSEKIQKQGRFWDREDFGRKRSFSDTI